VTFTAKPFVENHRKSEFCIMATRLPIQKFKMQIFG
jgi:hypothetical protein